MREKKSLGARAVAMPLPVWVIGSYNQDRSANFMTAAWCGQCSSEPPCVAVSLRPSRLSHENILRQQAFTVNIAAQEQFELVDFFGLVSGRSVDKLRAAGLTILRSGLVPAPYIAEFPLNLECRLLKSVEIGSHTQFIGEIVDVKAGMSVLDAEGRPDMAKLAPLFCSPADRGYYGLGARLGNAYSAGLVRVREGDAAKSKNG